MRPDAPGCPAAAASLPAGPRPAIEGAAGPEEIHIAGVLVQCHPSDLMHVVRTVDSLETADVFQSSADGRLVVVIEAANSRAVLAVIDEIRALRGVVNVALVYQHAESAAEMQQELELPADGLELPGDGLELPAGGLELPAGGLEPPAGALELPAGGLELPAGSLERPAGGWQPDESEEHA